MIEWVPFELINAKHLQLLAKSLEAAPEVVRHDARDFVQRLASGELRLFEYADGIVVCHKDGTRMVIDAISCDKLGECWKLVPTLHRLAADWSCDTIQTTVFDKRIAGAIVKLGGQIESYDLILAVEADGEQ